jgi:ABC-type transport system involved in cytochrome c biogenesis permease component
MLFVMEQKDGTIEELTSINTSKNANYILLALCHVICNCNIVAIFNPLNVSSSNANCSSNEKGIIIRS